VPSAVIAAVSSPDVIPPGFDASVAIGRDEVQVRIDGYNHQDWFLYATLLSQYVPNKTLAHFGNITDLFNEFDSANAAAVQCHRAAQNAFGQAGCTLGHAWDIYFAIGRYATRLGIAAAKDVAKAVAAAIENALFAKHQVQDISEYLLHSTKVLTIPAAVSPPARATTPVSPNPQPARATPVSPNPQPPAQLPGHDGTGQVTPPKSIQPPVTCAVFTVYAQNRWNPVGAALRGAPDHTSPKLGGFTGNTPLAVDGWTYGSTPYPNNPAPFNSNVWFHLANGSGWVSFPGVRGAPTSYDPTSNDGGPAAPVRPECKL
jgi:hypothetical protein